MAASCYFGRVTSLPCMAPFPNGTARLLAVCVCACSPAKSDKRCNSTPLGQRTLGHGGWRSAGWPLFGKCSPNADPTDSNDAKTKGGRSYHRLQPQTGLLCVYPSPFPPSRTSTAGVMCTEHMQMMAAKVWLLRNDQSSERSRDDPAQAAALIGASRPSTMQRKAW
jgi:hypothetical protein